MSHKPHPILMCPQFVNEFIDFRAKLGDVPFDEFIARAEKRRELKTSWKAEMGTAKRLRTLNTNKRQVGLHKGLTSARLRYGKAYVETLGNRATLRKVTRDHQDLSLPYDWVEMQDALVAAEDSQVFEPLYNQFISAWPMAGPATYARADTATTNANAKINGPADARTKGSKSVGGSASMRVDGPPKPVVGMVGPHRSFFFSSTHEHPPRRSLLGEGCDPLVDLQQAVASQRNIAPQSRLHSLDEANLVRAAAVATTSTAAAVPSAPFPASFAHRAPALLSRLPRALQARLLRPPPLAYRPSLRSHLTDASVQQLEDEKFYLQQQQAGADIKERLERELSAVKARKAELEASLLPATDATGDHDAVVATHCMHDPPASVSESISALASSSVSSSPSGSSSAAGTTSTSPATLAVHVPAFPAKSGIEAWQSDSDAWSGRNLPGNERTEAGEGGRGRGRGVKATKTAAGAAAAEEEVEGQQKEDEEDPPFFDWTSYGFMASKTPVSVEMLRPPSPSRRLHRPCSSMAELHPPRPLLNPSPRLCKWTGRSPSRKHQPHGQLSAQHRASSSPSSSASSSTSSSSSSTKTRVVPSKEGEAMKGAGLRLSEKREGDESEEMETEDDNDDDEGEEEEEDDPHADVNQDASQLQKRRRQRRRKRQGAHDSSGMSRIEAMLRQREEKEKQQEVLRLKMEREATPQQRYLKLVLSMLPSPEKATIEHGLTNALGQHQKWLHAEAAKQQVTALQAREHQRLTAHVDSLYQAHEEARISMHAAKAGLIPARPLSAGSRLSASGIQDVTNADFLPAQGAQQATGPMLLQMLLGMCDKVVEPGVGSGGAGAGSTAPTLTSQTTALSPEQLAEFSRLPAFQQEQIIQTLIRNQEEQLHLREIHLHLNAQNIQAQLQQEQLRSASLKTAAGASPSAWATASGNAKDVLSLSENRGEGKDENKGDVILPPSSSPDPTMMVALMLPQPPLTLVPAGSLLPDGVTAVKGQTLSIPRVGTTTKRLAGSDPPSIPSATKGRLVLREKTPLRQGGAVAAAKSASTTESSSKSTSTSSASSPSASKRNTPPGSSPTSTVASKRTTPTRGRTPSLSQAPSRTGLHDDPTAVATSLLHIEGSLSSSSSSVVASGAATGSTSSAPSSHSADGSRTPSETPQRPMRRASIVGKLQPVIKEKKTEEEILAEQRGQGILFAAMLASNARVKAELMGTGLTLAETERVHREMQQVMGDGDMPSDGPGDKDKEAEGEKDLYEEEEGLVELVARYGAEWTKKGLNPTHFSLSQQSKPHSLRKANTHNSTSRSSSRLNESRSPSRTDPNPPRNDSRLS